MLPLFNGECVVVSQVRLELTIPTLKVWYLSLLGHWEIYHLIILCVPFANFVPVLKILYTIFQCWSGWVDLNHQPTDLVWKAGFEPAPVLDIISNRYCTNLLNTIPT